MRSLSELADEIRDCVAAAWIDIRTGDVIERCVVREDSSVDPALAAATEVTRSPERPPRMVLLSPRHVHIVQRPPGDAHRALIVICERSPNIGLAVAMVRAYVAGEVAGHAG